MPPTKSSTDSSHASGLRPVPSIPWCARILSDPSTYAPIPTPSRHPKNHLLHEDTLVAATLASPSTISTWQTFIQQRPDTSPPTPPTTSPSTPPPAPSPPSSAPLIAILSLGPALNGHSHTLHGGATSLILDECLGLAAQHHRYHDADGTERIPRPGGALYTAYLHTTFVKPIPTPCVVLCRAWVVESLEAGRGGKGTGRESEDGGTERGKGKRQRRKFRVEGSVEDGEGAVLARAEALMVLVEAPEGRLRSSKL